jgi:hypothetical protein
MRLGVCDRETEKNHSSEPHHSTRPRMDTVYVMRLHLLTDSAAFELLGTLVV